LLMKTDSTINRNSLVIPLTVNFPAIVPGTPESRKALFHASWYLGAMRN
jgi:hypothetical protein